MRGVDRRFQFKEIPMLLAKLERNSSPDKFNIEKCRRCLRVSKRLFYIVHMLYFRGKQGNRDFPSLLTSIYGVRCDLL